MSTTLFYDICIANKKTAGLYHGVEEDVRVLFDNGGWISVTNFEDALDD